MPFGKLVLVLTDIVHYIGKATSAECSGCQIPHDLGFDLPNYLSPFRGQITAQIFGAEC